MDPKSKQEAKTKARSMMRVFSDKMEVTGAKFSGGQFADLEIAVFKATLEDDFVPKEKHVKTLKQTTAGGAPRQEVNCVISNLVKRIETQKGEYLVNCVISNLMKRIETHKGEYLVTLKSLVVFHRLMREVDPTFQEEIPCPVTYPWSGSVPSDVPLVSGSLNRDVTPGQVGALDDPGFRTPVPSDVPLSQIPCPVTGPGQVRVPE
eukprot:gene11873-14979_t